MLWPRRLGLYASISKWKTETRLHQLMADTSCLKLSDSFVTPLSNVRGYFRVNKTPGVVSFWATLYTCQSRLVELSSLWTLSRCWAWYCVCHHWKNGDGRILYSGLWVSECLSESVRPENVVDTVSHRPMKGISPIFGHRCICVRRVPISFWDQRSRLQQAMTRKTDWIQNL